MRRLILDSGEGLVPMREMVGTMPAFSRVSQTQYWTEAIGFHAEPTAAIFCTGCLRLWHVPHE